MTGTALSAAEARRLFLRAQGLVGVPDRRAGVDGVLRRLGAVQLDTISVLARSHELVPYARLGAVGRFAVEDAYWGGRAFEYWSHAACVLPLEQWPWFAFRRRKARARLGTGGATDAVRRRLVGEGPLTATDLGGARKGAAWWDWSDAKRAVELLLLVGEVVCVERRGWRRVYAVAEQAVPPDLLALDPSDDECVARLVAESGRVLGVATRADLAGVHRLPTRVVDPVAAGLAPVQVEGWREPAWADTAALAAGPARGRHRTTLVSPFDSLVWDRARTQRVFGLTHRLEAYVPKAKRVHGYFAMPLLAGGKLVGRVDPAREGRTLVARQASVVDLRWVPAVHEALAEAAAWVGCDDVVLERPIAVLA